MSRTILESAGPDLVRSPFIVLVDQAEKAPWRFTDIRARSFVDKEMRAYVIRTEVRFLGIGAGDYCLAGFEGRVGIERKSVADFQGTLLGWPHESDGAAENTITIDRRARFKRELARLSRMECTAVIVEGTLGECLGNVPSWGKRTAGENAKYLHSTYIAWQQEFRRVPWIFCDDPRSAEITALRILEQFWARKQKMRKQQESPLFAALVP